MAIFVMDEQHRHIGLAQRGQCVHRVERVGNHRCLAHQFSEVDGLTTEQRGGDVARLHHPDRLFHRPFCNRNARVRRSEQPFADGIAIGIGIKPIDFGARGHHFAHWTVGEADHAGDDRAFMLLNDARFRCLGDHQMQFLGGHLAFTFTVEPEQPEDRRARPVEQPDQRRGQPRDPLHWHSGERGDGFGFAQRELLGHQFADDE